MLAVQFDPTPYDPFGDLAARHPGWSLRRGDLGPIDELLSWARRVIVLHEALQPSQERSALAHAIAHLDLRHQATLPGWFEQREERAADRLAATRLVAFEAIADTVQDGVEASGLEALASRWEVDLPMARVRLGLLTSAERRRLRALGRANRSGP